MPQPLTVKAVIAAASRDLATHSSTAQLDAELLFGYVLQHDRGWLTGHRDDLITPSQSIALTTLIAQRQTGVPLAYLTGTKEFYGRPFVVTPDVLIPRPDSESIIETSIAAVRDLSTPRILEIGTGSGCLAITLAAELPSSHVTATEISPSALKIAQQNAQILGVADRMTFRTQDLLDGESGDYDLLVTNLPYVPTHWLTDENKKQYHLVSEPHVALHGGDDGMDVFTPFLQQFAAHPVSTQLILEHGDEQSEAVKKLIDRYLPGATCVVIHDLTGRERGWQVKLT